MTWCCNEDASLRAFVTICSESLLYRGYRSASILRKKPKNWGLLDTCTTQFLKVLSKELRKGHPRSVASSRRGSPTKVRQPVASIRLRLGTGDFFQRQSTKHSML